MLRWAVRTLVGIAVLALLFAGSSLLVLKQTGSRALSVQSGSMEPAITKGDLVIVKPVPHYQVGDVITFMNPRDKRTTITHRVIAVDEGKRTLQTKGDANNTADRAISMRLVVGKVHRTVPLAGRAIDFMRTPLGLLLAAYIPALLIIIAEFKRLAVHYRGRGYLLPGRRPYRERLRTRRSLLAARFGVSLLAGGLVLGIVLPVYAALSDKVELTGNTISSATVKNSYQVCNFPATSTLLSYALIDVFYPELPDPPITLTEPITPGTYKITAVSHDNHIARPNSPTQPNERWFAQLYGSDMSAPLHQTGVTDDIPDNIDQTVTVLNDTVTFTEPITAIRYVHNAFLTGIEKNNFGGVRTYDELTEQEKRQVIWNSVHPGCITFDRLPNPAIRPQ